MAYTISLSPGESTAFRLVQTSGRDYAITLLGRRIFLLTRKGKTLVNPAISGMTGVIATNGTVRVKCPDFAGSAATLTFTDGVLTRLQRRNGTVERKAKDQKMMRMAPSGKYPLLRQWSPKQDKEIDYWAYWKMQKGFRRLRLWFFNPNGAGTFFAELALLALAAVLSFRRWPLQVSCGALFAFFFWCELKTGSRGAFTAMLLGGLAMAVLHVHSRFSWKRFAAVGGTAAVLMALVGFGVFGSRVGRRLFATDWSNLERLRIWREVPRMLAAAPGGWGVNQSGAVFCDWFQDPKTFHPLVWLVNSHLTWIVELGCWFCAAYVFVWLAVTLLSLRSAWRGSRTGMLVAGLAVMLFVSAWFSTVGVFCSLWVLPGLALLAFLVRNAKRFDRTSVILLSVSLLLAAAAPFAIVRVGRAMAPVRGGIGAITRAAGVTVVGAGVPEVYLVPDEEVLSVGGGMGRDVRRHIAKRKKVPAIAVADSVKQLPMQMDRLVLAGHAGAEYLRLRQERLATGDFPRARKIVFLSPPFTPRDVPGALVDAGSVLVVYGEHSMRLCGLRDSVPPWVKVVKGGELYVPGWVRFLEERR